MENRKSSVARSELKAGAIVLLCGSEHDGTAGHAVVFDGRLVNNQIQVRLPDGRYWWTAIDGIKKVLKHPFMLKIRDVPEDIGLNEILPFLEKMEKLSIKNKTENKGEICIDFTEKKQRQRAQFYLRYFFKHFPKVHISFPCFNTNNFVLHVKSKTPATDYTSFIAVKAYLESVEISLIGDNWLGQISTNPNEFVLCFFSAEDKNIAEEKLRENLFKEDQVDFTSPDLISFVQLSLLALQQQWMILDVDNIQERLIRINEFMGLKEMTIEQPSIEPTEELYLLMSKLLNCLIKDERFTEKERKGFQEQFDLITDELQNIANKKSSKTNGTSNVVDEERFQKIGGDRYNATKFPEATFWFFQHQMYFMDGKSYPNVKVAHSRCNAQWNNFVKFLEMKSKTKDINEDTDWVTVKELWNKRFQNLGGERYNANKFPEAAFWFFQHRMHNMDGEPYSNVNVAISRCDITWDKFPRFLEQKHRNDEINIDSTWVSVEELWKKKNKVITTTTTTTTAAVIATPTSTISTPERTEKSLKKNPITNSAETTPAATKNITKSITKNAAQNATKTTIVRKTGTTGSKVVTIIKKKKKKKKKKKITTATATASVTDVAEKTITVQNKKNVDTRSKRKQIVEYDSFNDHYDTLSPHSFGRIPARSKIRENLKRKDSSVVKRPRVNINPYRIPRPVSKIKNYRLRKPIRRDSLDYTSLPEVTPAIRDVRDMRDESGIHNIMPICDIAALGDFPVMGGSTKVLDLRLGSNTKKVLDLRKNNNKPKKVLDLRKSNNKPKKVLDLRNPSKSYH